MPDRFRLAPAAEADLFEAWVFGAERWSPERADRYQNALYDLLDTLVSHPEMAPERAEFGIGVRIHPYRSHVILYRADPDGLVVLRFLHGRSDWRDALDPFPPAQ